ncbi:OLC1v1025305C1 [Oldenlandia corymbosa var. corymbosa]|uniref:OLC1v1025305C1 n=1 Tax=Oldenlandia corymbosa var. corymbosa TaxID=529605 RepID=A0AAV1C7G8_OLDCO|nr:OLC1v1025305C1 [Oldenlandia corymbosa var. corymbosa]
MAMATAYHQSTMLCSIGVRNLCINPLSLPSSNMVSFPGGCCSQKGRMVMIREARSKKNDRMRVNIEAKLGKATKKPSAYDERKWSNYGLITESLPNGMFRIGLVQLVDNKFVRVNDDVMLGYVSGRIRQNKIKVVPGDIVEIEISSYDTSKGRIIYRLGRRDIEKLTGLGPKDDFDD